MSSQTRMGQRVYQCHLDLASLRAKPSLPRAPALPLAPPAPIVDPAEHAHVALRRVRRREVSRQQRELGRARQRARHRRAATGGRGVQRRAEGVRGRPGRGVRVARVERLKRRGERRREVPEQAHARLLARRREHALRRRPVLRVAVAVGIGRGGVERGLPLARGLLEHGLHEAGPARRGDVRELGRVRGEGGERAVERAAEVEVERAEGGGVGVGRDGVVLGGWL